MKIKSKKREEFKTEVLTRDKFICQVCKIKGTPETLDAHHITDRNEMPNGGYVLENGITVHKEKCHLLVEEFHISNGVNWRTGLHPDDLYKMINSSKEKALAADD